MKKYAEKIDELIEIADCSEDAEEKAWIDTRASKFFAFRRSDDIHYIEFVGR